MRSILLVPFFAVLSGCAVIGMGSSDTPNTYLVFFDAKSADLSPDAQVAVNRAAAAIRSKHSAHVIVAGEPKTVTAPGFNPQLADPRFAAVEQALIAGGVSPQIMARATLTDDQAKVGATGDRRVEIRLTAD